MPRFCFSPPAQAFPVSQFPLHIRSSLATHSFVQGPPPPTSLPISNSSSTPFPNNMLKSATLLLAALAVAHAAPAPQGVTEVIAPLGQIPDGCSVSSPKSFGFYISSMPGSGKCAPHPIDARKTTDHASPTPAAGRKVERQVAQIEDVRIQAHANPKPAAPSSSSSSEAPSLTDSEALFSADFELESATASSAPEASSSSSAEGPAKTGAVRGGVAKLLDGQIQTLTDVAPSPVVRPAEDTLKTSIYRFSSYIKPISNYFSPSGRTTTTAERISRECPLSP